MRRARLNNEHERLKFTGTVTSGGEGVRQSQSREKACFDQLCVSVFVDDIHSTNTCRGGPTGNSEGPKSPEVVVHPWLRPIVGSTARVRRRS